MTTVGPDRQERNRHADRSTGCVIALVSRAFRLLIRRAAFALVTLRTRAGMYARTLAALVAVCWPIWADFRSDYARARDLDRAIDEAFSNAVRTASQVDTSRTSGQLRN